MSDELSRENLISSHVKITCYLHMWNYHLCYGYIINRAFHTKKLLKWNGLVFHWCLYNKEDITWPLGDTNFLFSKRNFVSPRGHVISSISLTYEPRKGAKSYTFACQLCNCTSHADWLFTVIIVTWTYEDLFRFVTNALKKALVF